MTIFELFSRRQRKVRNPVEPYQYENVPSTLRVQICHILRDAAGSGGIQHKESFKFWEGVHTTMTRELGLFSLNKDFPNDFGRCSSFIINASTENVIDIVEFAFFMVDTYIRQIHPGTRISNMMILEPEKAISELNYRFREHGVGYQFEGSQIIRVDTQITHEEMVKPTMDLLYDLDFQGANEEFLKAHTHYREGRYKEAIAEASKSLESTMKTICTRLGWEYKPSDTSNKLIDLLIKRELIPTYLHQHFNSLRSTLESGIPVLRNKTSGHGQGESSVEIPDFFASYAINLTASNILFLVNCYRDKQKA